MTDDESVIFTIDGLPAVYDNEAGAWRPYRCPTFCDDDCEALCHEGHQVTWKRDHDLTVCEAMQTPAGTWSTASIDSRGWGVVEPQEGPP